MDSSAFAVTIRSQLTKQPKWTHISYRALKDLLAMLGKGKTYTKLDLAHAYQQIELDEKSKELATINKQKGLYRYWRLPFSVSSPPAIFQRTIKGILYSIPNVAVYIDDILVTGSSESEHLKSLGEVLACLEAAGLRLK